jgi:hypothetical protein
VRHLAAFQVPDPHRAVVIADDRNTCH